MRRTELVNLKLSDIDTGRAVLTVRQGKGKKDRVVPMGVRAAAWLDAYRCQARPQLALGRDTDVLFLSRSGTPLSPRKLSGRVSGYIRRSGVGKPGSCHLFRHTTATLMLESIAFIAVKNFKNRVAYCDALYVLVHGSYTSFPTSQRDTLYGAGWPYCPRSHAKYPRGADWFP